jgi:hypothetical protein
VDGVIRTLLGGATSNETREVLMSGTNPLLTRRGGMAADGQPSPAGLAQIVGLALGAPEFQRR